MGRPPAREDCGGFGSDSPPGDLLLRIFRLSRDPLEVDGTIELSIELSGSYPIAAQSERSIRRDSIASVIGSIACLLALFIVAFRRPLPLFTMTFAPIAVGVLYGFGVYSLISHSVTPQIGRASTAIPGERASSLAGSMPTMD